MLIKDLKESFKNPFFWVVISVSVGAILIFRYETCQHPVWSDEMRYIVDGSYMLEKGRFDSLFFTQYSIFHPIKDIGRPAHMPFYYMLTGFLNLLFKSPKGILLFNQIIVLISALMVWIISSRYISDDILRMFSSFLFLFFPLLLPYANTYMMENFCVFLMLIFLYFFINFTGKTQEILLFFVVFLISILTRVYFLLLIIPFLIYLTKIKQEKKIVRYLISIFCFFVSLAIMLHFDSIRYGSERSFQILITSDSSFILKLKMLILNFFKNIAYYKDMVFEDIHNRLFSFYLFIFIIPIIMVITRLIFLKKGAFKREQRLFVLSSYGMLIPFFLVLNTFYDNFAWRSHRAYMIFIPSLIISLCICLKARKRMFRTIVYICLAIVLLVFVHSSIDVHKKFQMARYIEYADIEMKKKKLSEMLSCFYFNPEDTLYMEDAFLISSTHFPLKMLVELPTDEDGWKRAFKILPPTHIVIDIEKFPYFSSSIVHSQEFKEKYFLVKVEKNLYFFQLKERQKAL